ncbi:hypothetical protein [Xanthobacter pseudotagetidis]|uniref:hypothetical protein n=1 Tax=Xanthobacter pseudotagetidis TaxID=3119911 RepID=UPI00372A6B26
MGNTIPQKAAAIADAPAARGPHDQHGSPAAGAHGHPHDHAHDHAHVHDRHPRGAAVAIRPSLLRLSLAGRLAIAAALLAPLWLAVFLVVGAP